MRVAQFSWSESDGWTAPSSNSTDSELVFFFGKRQALACGRRLPMGQRTADEVKAAGLYSYGEISPHRVSGVGELNNQTMTVTTLAAVVGGAGA
jgi:hypothetical protein